jgi:hypothetical protein
MALTYVQLRLSSLITLKTSLQGLWFLSLNRKLERMWGNAVDMFSWHPNSCQNYVWCMCTNLEGVSQPSGKKISPSFSVSLDIQLVILFYSGSPSKKWNELKMIKTKGKKASKQPMFLNTSMNCRLSSPSQATASIKRLPLLMADVTGAGNSMAHCSSPIN